MMTKERALAILLEAGVGDPNKPNVMDAGRAENYLNQRVRYDPKVLHAIRFFASGLVDQHPRASLALGIPTLPGLVSRGASHESIVREAERNLANAVVFNGAPGPRGLTDDQVKTVVQRVGPVTTTSNPATRPASSAPGLRVGVIIAGVLVLVVGGIFVLRRLR